MQVLNPIPPPFIPPQVLRRPQVMRKKIDIPKPICKSPGPGPSEQDNSSASPANEGTCDDSYIVSKENDIRLRSYQVKETTINTGFQ